MKVLLLGCGNNRSRKLALAGTAADFSDSQLVTLDIDPNCGADVIFNLDHLHIPNASRLPFDADYFDEIHAYEVLEHIGSQGDWYGFFLEWEEYWRVLKPGGFFIGSVPAHGSEWVWGDPGHKRHLPPQCFSVFLDQREYVKQIGKTAMTDYRHTWSAPYHFEAQAIETHGGMAYFVLRKGEWNDEDQAAAA